MGVPALIVMVTRADDGHLEGLLGLGVGLGVGDGLGLGVGDGLGVGVGHPTCMSLIMLRVILGRHSSQSLSSCSAPA